jgi:HEAT repeat protein
MSPVTEDLHELVTKLNDPSWMVRRSVVQRLGLSGGAASLVLDALIHQRDSEARIAAAVDTLVHSVADIEKMIEPLSEHHDPAVVADVAQILGRRRNQAALPILTKLSRHPDDNVAVGAIEGLGKVGGRAAVEAMVDSIKTENFFRVFPAIDVLGRSGDPRAVEPLAELLGNPTYLVDAARALGKTGERSAVKPLMKLLKTRSDSVVRVAAADITELREKFADKSGGDTRIIDELMRMQGEPENVRQLIRALATADVPETIAICGLLGAIGNAEAAVVLTSLLDGAPKAAAAAASALRKIEKGSDQPILESLRDGSSERRKAILPIVYRFSAAEEVAKCLNDEDPTVRTLACEALARLGNGAVVEQLFPLLADKNLQVVHAAVSAIQALGNRSARELAIRAASDADPKVRRAAVRIMTYFGDDAALQPMLAALKDSDARVQELALQGLPYLESPLALEALFEAARSPHEKMRALALRALGLVPNVSERVISVILKGLTDSDSWVRYYACQSLGRLAYEPATTEIVRLLRDEAGQVRVSAVEALSHFKSTRALESLREAALSSEIEIRRAALVGLGFVHRSEDLPIILEGVHSEDLSTRLMALSSLANFPSAEAAHELCAAAEDGDEQVSSTAINFLAARAEATATRFLVKLLENDKTKARAKTALLASAKERLPALLETLETANDELAPALISVISRMEKADARIGLLSAIHSGNPAARKAAAAGLAARREPEMIAALQDVANFDVDPDIRQICKLLLHD